jgi:hypothetical protein
MCRPSRFNHGGTRTFARRLTAAVESCRVPNMRSGIVHHDRSRVPDIYR